MLEYLPFFTLIVGALTSYFGSKIAMSVSIARIEERIIALERDFRSDHMALDKLEEKVSGISNR